MAETKLIARIDNCVETLVTADEQKYIRVEPTFFPSFPLNSSPFLLIPNLEPLSGITLLSE